MSAKRTGNKRPKIPSSHYVGTRSGNVLKVHRNLGERWTVMKEAKLRRRVERLRGLPKSRFKRFLWRLNPRRQAAYWFSRDGGIMALKIAGIVIVVGFVITLGVFAYFRKDLPNITDISGDNLGGSISYYDRTGKTLLWQDYNAVKRVPVASGDISNYMKEATVATEDRNFYSERGFDIKGIIRAAVNNITHRGSTQGGSTITQQLVKLTQDWTQQRNLARKVKELILAVELERSYTKDEILTGYLNAAPYGGVDYGVQTAASDYFHKSAKDLTLPEAAMLAAIPKSPSVYSPYNTTYFDKTAFLDRYNYVLDSMAQTGKIKKSEAEAAKKYNILAEVQPQQTKYAGIQAPYFVLAAKNEISAQFAASGSSKSSGKIGGWKVITTLDLNLQKIAEGVVASNQPNALAHGADEQAIAAEDVKTGQMVALVGGTDFNNPDHGKINYAQWNISPGSSFKPYDYVSMIENRTDTGAGSVLYDSQTKLPDYPCTVKGLPPPKGNSNCLQDYDFRYPGPETLRYALGGSRNVPAVKAMLSVVPGKTADSVNKTITTANALMNSPGAYKCFAPGADVNTATKADETQCYESSAIGDGAYMHLDQHVNGLASLARMGNAIPATYILKIYDSKSNTKPFYEWKQPKGTQVVRPDAAYIVDNMASDPNASYLPFGYYKWHNYNGWRTAIKTGTTNNGFDGLMMAWNTQYAVGSWVGYHTRNKALLGFMEYSTTPLTRGFMTQALDALHTQPVNWTEPPGIQHLPAYVITSHVGIGSVEPSPATDIFPSWYKPRGSTQNVTIDKVSGKLATDCTPPLARQNQGGNSTAEHFSADIFTGTAVAGTASGTDDVHNCNDVKPQITLTISNNGTQGQPTDCYGSCTIAAAVSAGTHPLDDPQYPQFPGTVNFSINGQVVKTLPTSGALSFTYTPSSSGTINVSAQVIDSVLYDATDSASVTATVNQPASLTLSYVKKPPNKVQFSWNDISDNPYTVCLAGGPSAGCLSSTAGTQTTSGVLLNGNYTATVKSNSGVISPDVSFTIP